MPTKHAAASTVYERLRKVAELQAAVAFATASSTTSICPPLVGSGSWVGAGLAFSATDELYASNGGGKLYQLDLATGAGTLVASGSWFGEGLAFFMLMGLMGVAEGQVARRLPPRWSALLARAPAPLPALGLQLMVLPAFARFFARSWLEAGMVEAVAELVPHVRCAVASAPRGGL